MAAFFSVAAEGRLLSLVITGGRRRARNLLYLLFTGPSIPRNPTAELYLLTSIFILMVGVYRSSNWLMLLTLLFLPSFSA